MRANEIRSNSIFSKASVCKKTSIKTRNDFYPSSSMATSNVVREGDYFLQSLNARRRYMRRGSRAPNMFGNSASRCRQEEILALAQLALARQTSTPAAPPTEVEIEFDGAFKDSKRREMITMKALNESMSSICTYDSTDDAIA